MKKKRVVIALGGNALGKDIEEQKEAVAKTAKVIVDLVQQGMDLIITHGNGPQVGMIQNAMDQLACSYENYKETPLPTCVAMSQGYIGIDLQNAIKYELYNRNMDVKVSTILSQVEAGHIVITCGGGGIPVVNDNGKLSGVNAVIDKDNASSLLAAELGADYLIILTAVEKVAINFGKENQEWLADLTVEQAREYIAQEQFAKGSMLPKIEAAIRFAESGEDRRTLITLLDKAAKGIAGKTGTVIHK